MPGAAGLLRGYFPIMNDHSNGLTPGTVANRSHEILVRCDDRSHTKFSNPNTIAAIVANVAVAAGPHAPTVAIVVTQDDGKNQKVW